MKHTIESVALGQDHTLPLTSTGEVSAGDLMSQIRPDFRLGCAGNMTLMRRQTGGSDGIHMTKEHKDLFSEESEKIYVHALLEPKERSHRVCMSLASDSQEQLAAL